MRDWRKLDDSKALKQGGSLKSFKEVVLIRYCRASEYHHAQLAAPPPVMQRESDYA